MIGSGFLAIWSDLSPEDETDWVHWMSREHAIERVSIQGFLACRIFRALGMAVCRYFILYELEKQDIVSSAEYLARLNAPTPWSRGYVISCAVEAEWSVQRALVKGGCLRLCLWMFRPNGKQSDYAMNLQASTVSLQHGSWSSISRGHRSKQTRRACGPTITALLVFC